MAALEQSSFGSIFIAILMTLDVQVVGYTIPFSLTSIIIGNLLFEARS